MPDTSDGQPVEADSLPDMRERLLRLVGKKLSTTRPLTAAERDLPEYTGTRFFGGAGVLVSVGDMETDPNSGREFFEIGVDWGYGWSIDDNTKVYIVSDDPPSTPPNTDVRDAVSRNRAATVVADAYLAALQATAPRGVANKAAAGAIEAIKSALRGETDPASLGIQPASSWGVMLNILSAERDS